MGSNVKAAVSFLVGVVVTALGSYTFLQHNAASAVRFGLGVYCQASEEKRMELRAAVSTDKGPLVQFNCENLEE